MRTIKRNMCIKVSRMCILRHMTLGCLVGIVGGFVALYFKSNGSGSAEILVKSLHLQTTRSTQSCQVGSSPRAH